MISSLFNSKLNRFFYYLLNLTWGLPLTAAGFLVFLVLRISGRHFKRHGGMWYTNIGKSWGGASIGLIFLTDEWDSPHVKNHEYGHSLQNALFGPLTLLLVTIPSVIRYWWFTYREKTHKPLPAYDSIWFEGTATKWGYATIESWQKFDK